MNREDIEKIETTNFIEEEVKKDLLAGKITEVVTRCPPEPSGYWHIGHAKAWLTDFGVAEKFGGYTNLRMDDTNPAKEDGDFAESYIEDLKWLGCIPKNVIYASEAYFDKIYNIAVNLIKQGKAYVCELSPEEISKSRGTFNTPGVNSPYRDRPIEESLRLFKEMKEGKYDNGQMCLRAKIDMAHPNMNMRDPVIYRIVKDIPHYKTGNKWCIYPMYDFAHPLEDALEGVTVSLCDISFEDHRPLYDWCINNAWDGEVKPRQIEFAQLMIENILIGKRYLKRIVNEGKVMGWDDPRFYTFVGLRRRGVPAEAVKNFIHSNGLTKAVSVLPLSAFEYHIRECLNKTATRVMAVLEPLKVIITNYNGEPETIEIENNPNDEIKTTHTAKFGREIYIEREDFAVTPPPKYTRLVLGGMVRLKNAYIIKCNNIVYKDNGDIDYLECEYLQNTRSGQDDSGIKVKGTIHFVEKSNSTLATARIFKNLTKLEYLEPAKELAKGVPLEEILEPDSMEEKEILIENFLKSAKPGDVFQFLREGYFCVDRDSTAEKMVFNKTISLKDTFNKKS